MKQPNMKIKRYFTWKHYDLSGQKCPEEQVVYAQYISVSNSVEEEMIVFCPTCFRSMIVWNTNQK